MKILTAALPACLLTNPILGALVGYGIYPYSPFCAYACDRSLSTLSLDCSMPMSMDDGMDMSSSTTAPQCRAGDTPWLSPLAWCMHMHCAEYNVSIAELESYWEKQSTEDPTVAPKWSNSTTLFNIFQPPARVITEADETLNFTAVVDPTVYESQYNALWTVQRENVVESGFGIAILVTGFGIPVILTWLGYMPYMSGVLDKVRPYLVYPSMIATYQVRPLPYLLGNAPTVGQGLYITLFFILNLILTAVNYEARQPHAWYATQGKEAMAFVSYRTGTLAFVLTPLIFFFSSRNNVLLWMTNWSHSTFLVLHRWVARMLALQVLLHTHLALPLYYPAEAKKQYWIWGAVATIAVMILVFASGLYVRSFAYGFFLIMHIVLSVFVLVGCWYHIKLWLPTWGYEIWLYVAFAVWAFDRLARLGRILKNVVRRAEVTDLGGGYVRLDIVGIRWGTLLGKHVYAYFPMLNTWRPWKNHLFSTLPTALLQHPSRRSLSSDGSTSNSAQAHLGVEKRNGISEHITETRLQGRASPIKKSTGMTKYLKAHGSLLTLLDGPYPNNPTKEILHCDRILLGGGGIGITGLLRWVTNHSNVKLYWSVRESASCLVGAMHGALSRIGEKEVRIGRRLDVGGLLTEEMEAGWARVGVVVSGPGSLCDGVRAAVVAAGGKGETVFEFEVEAYSW